MFTLTLSSWFGSPGENWLHINVVINWHLSKQRIRWPVSSDRIAGSGVDPSRLSIFWSYPQTSYSFSNDRRLKFIFLKFIWNTLSLCSYGPALLRSFFQTDPGRKNSASNLEIQAGKTLFTMATLYVQLLCSDRSKFDRWAPAENYAASWNLFTLTAEADIVLCQLVIFLTVFFHWMYKMKYSCYQELSRVFCHLWPVCLLGFWLRNASLVKVGNHASFSFFTLLDV